MPEQDRREASLERLLTIAEGVTGFKTKLRNVGVNTDDKKDAVILLDGDESVLTAPPSRGRGPTLMPTMIMRSTPQLFILLKELRPQQTDADHVNVGTRLNNYRIALINAVANDATMATLLGSNGSVVYNGCETDLKSGSSLSGTMRMDFAFTYPIIPTRT